MKRARFTILRFIFLFLLPGTVVAQQGLQINLTFGAYTNDHYHHKFHSEERRWTVQGRQLIYAIEAHNTLYADTLQLTTAEVDTLIYFIQDNKLNTSVTKQIKPPYNSKMDHDEEIRGSLTLAGRKAEIDIRAEGYNQIDEDPVGKKFRELEQILYGYAERDR